MLGAGTTVCVYILFIKPRGELGLPCLAFSPRTVVFSVGRFECYLAMRI